MEYYEITVTTYLLKDVHFTKSHEVISRTLNKAMLSDIELFKKHERNEYKLYSFNNFYPLESDGNYKAGRIYVFKIRSLDHSFGEKIEILLKNMKNENLNIIATDLKVIKRRHISELYTQTPALITVNNKHWLPNDDFLLLQSRFTANLEKKYKFFYGESISCGNSFIQFIEILNKKPFSIPFKNTKLLANKFRIVPNDTEDAQKLAFTAEACGIGEKSSSIGLGFCNAQYLK